MNVVLFDLQLMGDFPGRWNPSVFLFEFSLDLANIGNSSNLMQRDIDYSRLLRQGLKNRLSYPPYRIGNKFEILAFVEFSSGPDKARIAFVDQIIKRKSLVLIIAGHADDESEVCFYQFF